MGAHPPGRGGKTASSTTRAGDNPTISSRAFTTSRRWPGAARRIWAMVARACSKATRTWRMADERGELGAHATPRKPAPPAAWRLLSRRAASSPPSTTHQAARGSYVVQAQRQRARRELRRWLLVEMQRAPALRRPATRTRTPAPCTFNSVNPAVTLAAGVGRRCRRQRAELPPRAGLRRPESPRRVAAPGGRQPDPNIQDHVSSIVEAVPELGHPQGVYLSYAGFGGNAGGIYYHPDVAQLARGQGQFDVIPGTGRLAQRQLQVGGAPVQS